MSALDAIVNSRTFEHRNAARQESVGAAFTPAGSFKMIATCLYARSEWTPMNGAANALRSILRVIGVVCLPIVEYTPLGTPLILQRCSEGLSLYLTGDCPAAGFP
jgi:hypothetical protein